MNDPEDILKAARVSAPSDSLERRMQAAFAAAAQIETSRNSARMWRWAGALAATGLAATLILFFNRPLPTPADEMLAVNATTYLIESPSPMHQLLVESRSSRRPLPQFIVSVSTP